MKKVWEYPKISALDVAETAQLGNGTLICYWERKPWGNPHPEEAYEANCNKYTSAPTSKCPEMRLTDCCCMHCGY